MINSIIEAISISLKNEFTEKEYKFYMEEIKQDLSEPCFFISCVNSAHNLFLGKRYFNQKQFDIQYFPETDDFQRECNDVAGRMMNCLEYITIYGEEKPIMGTKMKYEIVDGVLNFYVNYDLFTYRKEQNEVMETMKSDINTCEGG